MFSVMRDVLVLCSAIYFANTKMFLITIIGVNDQYRSIKKAIEV